MHLSSTITACKYGSSALPLLMYFYVHCVTVLEAPYFQHVLTKMNACFVQFRGGRHA